MNKWRPKGWGNPHPEEFMTKPEFRPRDAFEAGADVMYEAIREEIEKELLTTQEARDVCTQVAIDYGELGGKATEQSLAEAFKRIAQAQLDKILKVFES